MHTQKKLFGKIKINVIPAPAENSAKPNTRFMRSPPWLRPQKTRRLYTISYADAWFSFSSYM